MRRNHKKPKKFSLPESVKRFSPPTSSVGFTVPSRWEGPAKLTGPQKPVAQRGRLNATYGVS